MFVAVVSQMYMDPNYLPENHPNDTMRSQRCHVKSGITKAEMKKGLFGVKKYTDLKTTGGYFTYASPKTTGISTSVSVGGQLEEELRDLDLLWDLAVISASTVLSQLQP